MISKMRKLTFLVYHKEYDAFLKDIRNLGVVHVAEKQQGAAGDPELQENIRLTSRLLATLSQFEAINAAGKKQPEATAGDPGRGVRILDEVEELQNEKNKLSQQVQSYLKDKATLTPWGDFKPESIRRLHDSGINTAFYICQEKLYNPKWEDEYNAIVISRASSKVYFITLTPPGGEPDIDAELVKLPARSLSQIEQATRETESALEDNQARLAGLAAAGVSSLKAAINKLHSEIEFSEVKLNSEPKAGEKLMLLQGWIPEKQEAGLVSFLDSQHAYYEVSNPVPGDDVPIQFSNKGLFAWFEPICKLYMLPKYSELDLTPFFAPFFMVFFGLCLGDIGYGLFLFLCATGFRLFSKKVSPSMKSVLSLVQILAFSTMVCGLLTGGFFGYSLYNLNLPFINKLAGHVLLDNNQMFRLSLILGVIQILFGMVLKVVNQTIQFGFKYAVSTLGWVIFFFAVIAMMLLPESVKVAAQTVLYVIMGLALAMVFLYNSPGKNIFLNIGLGLWDTYNMATGLLGDILSYVRLFALGLSGGILASVFNSLASGLMPDNVIAGPIVFTLIFVFGHAMNMFMNVLGALVHPMRLTFVEFFKNAGYEGGGKEYKPFKVND